MMADSGRVPSAPGSHPSGHAASGVDGASRFDPSRKRWLNPYLWPCRACGASQPSPEGHDPCIANLPGVEFACCGHGQQPGYIAFANGTVIRGEFEEFYGWRRPADAVRALRDSDGPRMAETNEDSARGEAATARAAESGIAQPLHPSPKEQGRG